MTETYVAVYYCPTDPIPIAESSRFLGAFDSAEDLVDHMNETSSGNKPFVCTGIRDLKAGETIVCKDFAPVEIHVTRLKITKKAKNIYISDTMTATTSKAGVTVVHTVPLTHCPMCDKYGVAADDDGHCSYACATGT
jgi:hypothetical protein